QMLHGIVKDAQANDPLKRLVPLSAAMRTRRPVLRQRHRTLRARRRQLELLQIMVACLTKLAPIHPSPTTDRADARIAEVDDVAKVGEQTSGTSINWNATQPAHVRSITKRTPVARFSTRAFGTRCSVPSDSSRTPHRWKVENPCHAVSIVSSANEP